MIGMMTDLNTFYVGVSKVVGIDKVGKVGDVFENPEFMRGNWADGSTVVLGQDCTQVSTTLEKLTEYHAQIHSVFNAPQISCLTFSKSWMIPSVKEGFANNFQQVRKNGSSFDVMWGLEEFTIQSKVNSETGILLNGTMDNTLTLKVKVGCNSDWESCQIEIPLVIQRTVSIELQKQK